MVQRDTLERITLGVYIGASIQQSHAYI